MYPTINLKETGINIRRIMDKRGITVKQVQKYLGLSSIQSVYHWLNGLSMPSIDNLYALSELLQVPIDTIVCGGRKPMVWEYTKEIKNPRDRRLFAYFAKRAGQCVA